MKSRLLVLELWGLGDLVIATPFLQAAQEKYAVTLIAKPFANDLQPRFWPQVRVESFIAPWTAFHGKYRFWRWPWMDMMRLRRRMRDEKFDFGVSARWDPRDHWMLKSLGVAERLGFTRMKSGRFLTQELLRPDPLAHRLDYWRVAGKALGLNVPDRTEIKPPKRQPAAAVLLHSGARLPARVWPLKYFHDMAMRLRGQGVAVQIACDPDQLSWWKSHGESATCPRSVIELLGLIDRSRVFIGNCSGPGHLAAICGTPTFTIYGPSLHEWFAPLHPAAEVFEGHACPYKPCSDYCRYAKPFCLQDVTPDEVWPRLELFTKKHPAAD